jgi:hypothetical protein
VKSKEGWRRPRRARVANQQMRMMITRIAATDASKFRAELKFHLYAPCLVLVLGTGTITVQPIKHPFNNYSRSCSIPFPLASA